MDISKETFNSIFKFEEEDPEEDLLETLRNHDVFESDKLFAGLQLYSHGLHTAIESEKKNKGAKGRIKKRVFTFLVRILKTVSIGKVLTQPDIHLYRDEYEKILIVFDDLLTYNERLENYEDCAIILKVKKAFLFKIKLID